MAELTCTQCNKPYELDDVWIKSATPLATVYIHTDLVSFSETSERFCSKECLKSYIEDHNLNIDLNSLEIDVIKLMPPNIGE